MSFGQFASTTQFYLYGKKYCTSTGWEAAHSEYPSPDILDDIDLSGNVYVVTGANSGIGYGIAGYLATRRARVYIVCRSAQRAQAAQENMAKESNNDKIHVLLCDCSLEVSAVSNPHPSSAHTPCALTPG